MAPIATIPANLQADLTCIITIIRDAGLTLSNDSEQSIMRLTHWRDTIDLIPDEPPTPQHDVEVYAVTANVSTAQDGWGVTVYGPTLYLHPDVQGILSDDGEATAKRIVAEWMTDVFHNVSRSDEAPELIVTATRTTIN